ncbi:hypothetical protein FOXB_11746 [Fusarium oxysporum f. sp. conglutinans Fo5176]|uniref:Uncharacterized protein n=1 Tax=Fusarium oxysporum (strain Fo5176) TaxID=660025 RepID=F9FZB4_FUSOF|nr:hypothetical protein FOXB_11746 [Fusarium oxysporum f. sp. conglutinans Fo5176]
MGFVSQIEKWQLREAQQRLRMEIHMWCWHDVRLSAREKEDVLLGSIQFIRTRPPKSPSEEALWDDAPILFRMLYTLLLRIQYIRHAYQETPRAMTASPPNGNRHKQEQE